MHRWEKNGIHMPPDGDPTISMGEVAMIVGFAVVVLRLPAQEGQ